jgi:hypothetical protein|tara:strand:+ start:1530 stop:1709 length:180 start_codon:yes stop_codon:yes gene_type:complete
MRKYNMIDTLLYGGVPSLLFLSGYLIGFFIGKVKYSPNIPEPNYLGGHPGKDKNVYRLD